jgi:DNA-binding NarL/FixJ family response regulator
MAKVKLALIDDHKIVRDGLKALLRNMDMFEIVAEGDNGHEAVEMADNPDIDVFLMDVAMPLLNGLDATEKIVAKRPDARIIILSMHATDDYVRRALSRGASGYMIKNMVPSELEQGVLKVAAGGVYLSPSIKLRIGHPESPSHAAEVESLTARQRDILLALADGMSTREMAESLSISAKTVETHRSQLMQKLNIFDVPGLVKFAIRHGMVSVD